MSNSTYPFVALLSTYNPYLQAATALTQYIPLPRATCVVPSLAYCYVLLEFLIQLSMT